MRVFAPPEGVEVKLFRCRVAVLAASWAVAAGAAWAQGAAAPASPTAAAKESKEAKEAREAAEAMERARRLAANPMRVILEASRVRRRAEGEPTPPLLPVAASSGAAAAVPAAGEVQPRAVPPTPREAAAEPASAVISSELAQARATAEPPAAMDAGSLPKPVKAPEVALPTLAVLLPEISRPTLVSRVDPELPARLMNDLDPNTVVTADLVIRPDGSVSQVTIVSENARAIGRFVVAALMQWRFAPLPTERPWRVELLFRPES
jgi:hypothetical protein